MISTEVTLRTQFYNLDPMNIVWHGNYVRYLEQARTALLTKIGYGYREMEASGFAWPIVDLSIKYVRPLRLSQDFIVRATLTEYENRLCFVYRVLRRCIAQGLDQGTHRAGRGVNQDRRTVVRIAAAIDCLCAGPPVIRRRHALAGAIAMMIGQGAVPGRAQSLTLAS